MTHKKTAFDSAAVEGRFVYLEANSLPE